MKGIKTLVLAGMLSAAISSYGTGLEVISGSADGANFSFLHTATGSTFDPDGAGPVQNFYMSGSMNAVGPGSLSGNISGTAITGINGTIGIANGGINAFDNGTLEIMNGSLDFGGLSTGDLVGMLPYSIKNSGGTEVATGTFYFYYYNFTGPNLATGPNNWEGNLIHLWGNNWTDTGGKDSVAGPLGLDLRINVPDGGMTLSLLGSALAGLGLMSRRFRRK